MGVTPEKLDAGWVAWLREWMRRGGDMSRAVEELRRVGFADRGIFAAIEENRPRGNALAHGAMRSLPLIRRAPPELRRLDAPFPIYTLEGFLAAGECADIIGMVEGHFQPSPIVSAVSDAQFRTSSTANLHEIDDPRSAALEEKIARTLGIRPPYGEGIQAQRYTLGQQYKPHYDCFHPDSSAYQRVAGLRGNRTWTFMVYLNDDLEGGATRFPLIDLAVQPKTGMALLWDNLREDGSPNPDTRHGGEPVTRGSKTIITHWFRVHGDGPVLFD